MWGKAGIAIAVLFVMSFGFAFVHPWGDLHAISPACEVLAGEPVPLEVRDILQSKCADCHSNGTHWPLYSRLAPASWLMEREVHDARAAMNLANWNEISPAEKISALTRIAAEARSGGMPPSAYALIHPSDRLTTREKEMLSVWVRAERKRIRRSKDQQERKENQ